MANVLAMKGKVAVVTGVARGISRELTLRLAHAGAVVVAAAPKDEKIDELLRACEREGGRALAVPTDVSHDADVERLAHVAVSAYGRIDVWINGAQVASPGRPDAASLADHARVIQVDLLGTIYGSLVAMKAFRAQGHGTLINVATMRCTMPAPCYASCSAAKQGVIGLTAALRQELSLNREQGIQVCALTPTPPSFAAKDVVDEIVAMAVRCRRAPLARRALQAAPELAVQRL